MIGKIIRGSGIAGLIRYLYGAGERNEHVNPHVVAGFRHPAGIEPAIRPDGTRDLSTLNRPLNQPLAALAPGTADDKPVWHCALRAAPEDPILTDEAWADIAHQVMHDVGLSPQGDDEAVRWAAIRHADDHIHIVATLARQDGTKPRTWNDFRRLRESCNKIEQRYALRGTAPADSTAASRPTRAEAELSRRQGRSEEPRVALRRAVATAAAASANEAQFFNRLRADGFLVRKRCSLQNPAEITGFAVAVPNHVNREGRPVWFGGGRLAPDLTLSKLRHRWATTTEPRTTAAESVARATAELRMIDADDNGMADAAWATADVLHCVAATVTGAHRRYLLRAADIYDRAARPTYGRMPQSTPAGAALRAVARALSNTSNDDHRVNRAVTDLLGQLAALTDAIAHLHATRHRTAQAEAAAETSDRLRHVYDMIHQRGGEDPSRGAGRHAASQAGIATVDSSSAVALANLDFPGSPVTRPEPPSTTSDNPPPQRISVHLSRGRRR